MVNEIGPYTQMGWLLVDMKRRRIRAERYDGPLSRRIRGGRPMIPAAVVYTSNWAHESRLAESVPAKQTDGCALPACRRLLVVNIQTDRQADMHLDLGKQRSNRSREAGRLHDHQFDQEQHNNTGRGCMMMMMRKKERDMRRRINAVVVACK